MKTIHSIAAATDFSPGSDAAVERAVQLAVMHRASLRLLHAFDVSVARSVKGIFDPQRLTRNAPPDVLMRQHLTELAASLAKQTGLRVETGFTIGKADRAIQAYVAAHPVAVVVIGSRAEPAIPGLGSTASKVVRTLSCPVLVVRSSGARPYEKVLLAVDMHEGSARVAAGALALFPGAQHHLLHAVDPELERVLGRSPVAKEQARLQPDSMHALAVRQLELMAREMTARFQHQVAVEVLDDVPSRAIVERAASLHADCVALGYHGPQGGAERLLGSMVQHVLQHTLRDVLVVP
jgi:nucleotide-binding universal stress UspA family protein